MMQTPLEIAESALEDCCDFFPKFKGIEATNPLTAEYIAQSLSLAESAACDDGRQFSEIWPLVRAELIGCVLGCPPEMSGPTLEQFAVIWSEF